MKKLLFSLAAVMLMTACGNKEKQLQEYVKSHNLAVRYYQDFGWPAVEL